MCSVEQGTRMKKEEFCELNLKNFVSLNNFNDPSLSSKDIISSKDLRESSSKKRASPMAKMKKSKTKTSSKEILLKSKVEN